MKSYDDEITRFRIRICNTKYPDAYNNTTVIYMKGTSWKILYEWKKKSPRKENNFGGKNQKQKKNDSERERGGSERMREKTKQK